ncbi:hypothetical protein [Pseudoflavonifractor phocaeensis]|uniref:hypothetical protein n=1 Tax=Pseudoflavonifractor phocaeensis TaxID=1870988 RepID=UPI001F22880E|nr:hypothetical protein [Pseudoflavonifractor phocaeensis]MCF2595213.1 hypothetical protein [Pseudoflavonifractor phocaeensis]
MTDLMRMLYEFIVLRRMGRAWDDPEYRDFSACAQKKEAELREKLDREETQLLEDLLRELSCRHSVELETVFQSTLELCRELNGVLCP